MRKILLSILFLCVAFFFVGCKGSGGEKAYFNGILTLSNGSVYFRDQANYITMSVGEESLKKLKVASVSDSTATYWAEFYGYIEDRSPKDAPVTDIVVHLDKLIKLTRDVPILEDQVIAGFYECLIDGVKQQLIVHPDYTYTWTIYPHSKYEIITLGSWHRTSAKELFLSPFSEQPDLLSPSSNMTYAGTVGKDGDIYIDSSKLNASFPDIASTEISEEHLSERVRKQREINRQKIAEEDAKRRATPRPGATSFEFDSDSQALVEVPNGTTVFWKVYL